MGTLVFQANLGGAVNLIGPNTASTVNFTLPSADGTSGQALVTNGSGTLSFSTFTSGAAGSNTQVQFNSSGAFAGSSNLTFNGTTLTAANTSITTSETLSYGTANGVAYLNGSKVVTTGSALTFDGTNLGVGITSPGARIDTNGVIRSTTAGTNNRLVITDGTIENRFGTDTSGVGYLGTVTNHPLQFLINSSEQMRLTSTGLGIGTSSPAGKFHVNTSTGYNAIFQTSGTAVRVNYLNDAASANVSAAYRATDFAWQKGDGSEVARIDSSGNLLVGTTTNYSTRLVSSATNNAFAAINTTATAATAYMWNQATSGNNLFIEFETEGTLTTRGSISYNRAVGLVAYNTTSDYRAKDISGPLTDSGIVIDSVPVYMGKMKGATQERPMFIAHETPPYAHTGEKDAVDEDGKPIFQQMDASALIPVMWAEIQSLRARVAQLEGN